MVQLSAAQRAQLGAPVDVGEHLDLAQRMAREALAEARRSVWNLRAGALERGTLADALRGLAEHASTSSTRVRFAERGAAQPLQLARESALLRVCQEALANTMKHAHATDVRVELVYDPDSVTLSVHDNGTGFDTSVLELAAVRPGPWGGFGLLGIRARLSALGGTLEVSCCDGMLVRATIPRVQSMPEQRVADASRLA